MDLDLDKIGSDLLKLALKEGPTQTSLQISQPDPRIGNNFPIFFETERIIKELDLSYEQDLGNLVVYQGIKKVDENQLIEEIKQIPVTLGAHLDEITYIVSNVKNNKGDTQLIPICSPPKRTALINPKCKIVGFRYGENYELSTIGYGIFKVEYTEKTERTAFLESKYKKIIDDQNYPTQLREIMGYMLDHIIADMRANPEFKYFLETDADITIGDMVIQDYNYTMDHHFNAGSILHVKALDDRVGCIAVLYALKELSKLGIPCKAILTSSEEGVNKDVSWGRLVRPTYQRFCTNDKINIICDGIDGAKLKEFERNRGQYMSEAVVVPYTSLGKGGGDPGIFSLIRDVVLPKAKIHDVLGVPTTDYVSRSYDSAIMHDFPLIGFVDWVNGKILDRNSRCHLDESVKLEQVQNIIGVLVYTAAFFDYKIRNKPNQIFKN